MTGTEKAEEFDYSSLKFDEPSTTDQEVQNPDPIITDTPGQPPITDPVEPAKPDAQAEPKTDTDVNTDTEYFVDENGNLSFEKDGKTFIARKKGEFNFNEECMLLSGLDLEYILNSPPDLLI